jgi:hypothetical protein
MALFEDGADYPSNEAMVNGVPQNHLYQYVSSTYLNGFINYTPIFYAVMVKRYSADDVFVERYPEGSWDKCVKSVDKLTNQFHTNYGVLKDDVMLLGETEGSIWFYWFDKDSSDCCIGRLDKSQHTKERVKELFISYLQNKWEAYIELPKPTGWIKG